MQVVFKKSGEEHENYKRRKLKRDAKKPLRFPHHANGTERNKNIPEDNKAEYFFKDV